jgi:diaminopimelate decarboxylase
MNNIELFERNVNTISESLNILSDMGIDIRNINLGGGFPEATIMPEKQLKITAEKLKSFIQKLKIKNNKIYFEPGRFFVGDAGVFIAEVVKTTKNRWIFLNLGNNICPKFAKCSLRFYNLSQIQNTHKYKTSFAGIIPTDQDVLAKDYFFTEKLKIGDKVLITNTGAYTLTFSNRFPYLLPQIFLVKGKNYKKIFSPLINHDFSIF